MKKARNFFGILAFFFMLAFLAGQPFFLFSQAIKEDKNQDQTIVSLTPAKTEAQAKQEQQKAEARKAAAQASAEAQAKADQKAEQARRDYESVLKTYTLKYISVEDFVRAAKLYIQDYSGPENAMTVRIYRINIPAFEDLLKKLDVDKRNIQFQIYTIIASKELPSGPFENALKNETKEIENKDLKRVLDEMKGLWNFRHYWVDNPSFLTIKDGSFSNAFRLVSSAASLNLSLLRVQSKGDEPGKRIISVGKIELVQTTGEAKAGFTLIDTSDVTFKEKGYLVVGVSGFQYGWSGAALILVINAEIK